MSLPLSGIIQPSSSKEATAISIAYVLATSAGTTPKQIAELVGVYAGIILAGVTDSAIGDVSEHNRRIS